MTAYSQEHLKALNYVYSFFCGGREGGGEGRSTECIMENSKMVKFLKNVFFYYFQGGTGLYTRGYVCKIL